MINEVLKEYGSPESVAAAYLPERYLIGPKLFPLFTLVIKIVFSVLTALALVGFGIRYGNSELTTQAFLSIFGKTLLDYLGGIISAFGNLVFIFAILQWALPASEFENNKNEKNWDPAILAKEPDPDQISIWSPIFEIIMTCAALLIFNLYPQLISINIIDGNNWTSIPILTNAFFAYLPWINLLWICQIVINIILLRQMHWTTLTHWFDIGLTGMSIIIAYFLVKGPALISISNETMIRIFSDTNTVAVLTKMSNIMPPVILVLIMVLESIDLLKNIYKLVFTAKQTLAN
ncbi:MAG: hypothetical protein WCK35_12730 [Chloroflexota bacterium]